MENSNVESKCKENNTTFNSLDSLSGISELDILRKAYELILENSDLFFKELGNAFIAGQESEKFNPTI
jgi:hypothetical protein